MTERISPPENETIEPTSPTGGKKHIELSPIHDFAKKLLQPEVLPRLREYISRQKQFRRQQGSKLIIPDFAPVSINLDITTACNFACDHCIDKAILNKGIKYDHQQLVDSLQLMATKGLKSVIVIGGGEPTVYPKFSETIRFMKKLGLQVAIVSNGSRNHRIMEIIDCLDENDWIRLSLDAGGDEIFTAMHKPKRAVTLDEICSAVPQIKKVNPHPKIGFSFIITWKEASIHDSNIIENIREIVPAAKRARDFCFDYIAFKPFLTRAQANNAEIVDLKDSQHYFASVVERICQQIEQAEKLATSKFRVYRTTNLKVLINKSYRNYTQQPHNCHMQFFRQVLSPLGLFNCPAYRNQLHGKIGKNQSYATQDSYEQTRKNTAHLIKTFDAAKQCKEVTCLYNHVNWWIEEMIKNPEKMEEITVKTLDEPDFFL